MFCIRAVLTKAGHPEPPPPEAWHIFLYCAPLNAARRPTAVRKGSFLCLPSIYPCSARCAPWAMLGYLRVAPLALQL